MNYSQSSDARRTQPSSSGVGTKPRKRTGKGKGRMMMSKFRSHHLLPYSKLPFYATDLTFLRSTFRVTSPTRSVKVFYSLQSPRFGSVSTPSAPTPSSNAPSPDFFSVLDPSLSSSSTAASQPQPPPQPESNPATNYLCIARLSAPVWVQIVGSKKSGIEGSEEKSQFGKITLKTCLSAICISRYASRAIYPKSRDTELVR